MTRVAVVCAVLALSLQAMATPNLSGAWKSPFGRIKIKQTGSEVTGKLVRPAKGCSLKKGTTVLTGVLLEDSLTGEITVCQTGDACSPSIKTFVILLVSKKSKSLSGALHLPGESCEIAGLGKKRGLRMKKRGYKPAKPKKPKKPAIAASSNNEEINKDFEDYGINPKRAQYLLEKYVQVFTSGNSDEARKGFIAATVADPSRVEAYNMVGVTFYAQQNYTEALLWYKKALEINPDFGDPFYNMACIYSLENKKDLSLRYLKIALLNGYVSKNDIDHIQEDPDFSNLKEDAEFKELIELAKTMAAGH